MTQNKTVSAWMFVFVVMAAALMSGCADTGTADPKASVISMFGAMEKDDKAALAHILDLPEMMKTYGEDYALTTDSPRVFTSPQQILDDLTGDGLTKKRWFSMQRIVNEAKITGLTATVEVTFVDKQASKGYRTNFGLHVVNERWKIYSFKSFLAPTS